MENSLIFQPTSQITIATNTFINVPVILKYEEINLIEVVKEVGLGFTMQIPIYSQDGTYLAKATGNRLYKTEEGKKAGVKIDKHPGLWVCTMNNQTLFEIKQQKADWFKTTAELYTPDGYFVKFTETPTPKLIDATGNSLNIRGFSMIGNTISGCKIGIWVKKDGSCSICARG